MEARENAQAYNDARALGERVYQSVRRASVVARRPERRGQRAETRRHELTRGAASVLFWDNAFHFVSYCIYPTFNGAGSYRFTIRRDPIASWVPGARLPAQNPSPGVPARNPAPLLDFRAVLFQEPPKKAHQKIRRSRWARTVPTLAHRLIDRWHWASQSSRRTTPALRTGACAELCLRTYPPHSAGMPQARVKPTFHDFRTFRTPHTRTSSSFLIPEYIYMKIMMKKNTTRNEGLKGAFVGAHMCGVRNVRNSANPRKAYVCALLTVCGGRVRTQRSAHTPSPPPNPPQACPRPAIFPASEKRPAFFACMFARSVLSTATQGAVNAEPAFTGRILSAGILSSRLVPADLFSQRDERTMRCKSCDTRVFPRLAEK